VLLVFEEMAISWSWICSGVKAGGGIGDGGLLGGNILGGVMRVDEYLGVATGQHNL
jgi:hypothetical protein